MKYQILIEEMNSQSCSHFPLCLRATERFHVRATVPGDDGCNDPLGSADAPPPIHG